MIRSLAALYALYWLAWLGIGVLVGLVLLWRRVTRTATTPPPAAHFTSFKVAYQDIKDEYDMATGSSPRGIAPASEGLGGPRVLRRAHSPCIPLWGFPEPEQRLFEELGIWVRDGRGYGWEIIR